MCPAPPSADVLTALAPLLADIECVVGVAGAADAGKWLIANAAAVDARRTGIDTSPRPRTRGSMTKTPLRVAAKAPADAATALAATGDVSLNIDGIDWEKNSTSDFSGPQSAPLDRGPSRSLRSERRSATLSHILRSPRTEEREREREREHHKTLTGEQAQVPGTPDTAFSSLDSAAEAQLSREGCRTPTRRLRPGTMPSFARVLSSEDVDGWTVGSESECSGAVTQLSRTMSRAPAVAKEVRVPAMPPLPRSISMALLTRATAPPAARLKGRSPFKKRSVPLDVSMIDEAPPIPFETAVAPVKELFVPQGDIMLAMEELERTMMVPRVMGDHNAQSVFVVRSPQDSLLAASKLASNEGVTTPVLTRRSTGGFPVPMSPAATGIPRNPLDAPTRAGSPGSGQGRISRRTSVFLGVEGEALYEYGGDTFGVGSMTHIGGLSCAGLSESPVSIHTSCERAPPPASEPERARNLLSNGPIWKIRQSLNRRGMIERESTFRLDDLATPSTRFLMDQNTANRLLSYTSSQGADDVAMLATAEQVRQAATQKWFDRFDMWWTPLLFMYIMFQLAVIPTRCGLRLPMSWEVAVFDVVLDLIMVAEIVLRARRPYSDRGVQVQCREQIARHYRGTDLWWDVLAMIPADLVALIALAGTGMSPAGVPWYRWLRVNRVMFARYLDDSFVDVLGRLFSGSPVIVRAGRTLLLFCLACHFVSCGFLLVFGMESDADVLALTAVPEIIAGTRVQRYCLVFDYSLKSLVGMGRPGKIVPHTDLQTAYSIGVALFGVCLYALMLATIGNLVAQMVSTTEDWRNQRNSIHDVLRYFSKTHTIPGTFQDEVRAYFHHEFWVSRLLLGKPHDVFGVLPTRISTKINMSVAGTIFNRIPMFAAATADEDFVDFIMSRLEARTYCRGEQIVTKGHEGDFMFFVMEGNVGVFDEALRRIIYVCGRGAALGEIALLQDCRRTATIVALDFCSCFILTRESFLEAERFFPSVIATVRREGEARLTQMKINDLFEKLPVLQPFKDDRAVLSVMLARAQPEVYPPDTVILSKGELSEKLYFISNGDVQTDAWRLSDGDYFGAMSCGLDLHEVETVRSVGNVTLFTLPRDALQQLAETSPELVEEIRLMAYARFVEYLMHDVFGRYLHAFAAGSAATAAAAAPGGGGVDISCDCGLFFERLATMLTERFIPAGTCVVAPGHPVKGILFLAEGALIEADCDSLKLEHDAGAHFGSQCLSADGVVYTAGTSLIAARDSVVYFLAAGDVAALQREHPRESAGFEALRKQDVLRTLSWRVYSATDEGMRKRCFMRWMCYVRLRKDARRYRYAGFDGPLLLPESHALLSTPAY